MIFYLPFCIFQNRIEQYSSVKPNERHTKMNETSPKPNNNNSPLPMTPSRPIPHSLEQRVFDFDKTAKFMSKKLASTRVTIEQCNDGPQAAEHLKLSIAPDAATLISQGDSLVLETHGKSPELSNTVIQSLALLRERFREMKHAKLVYMTPLHAISSNELLFKKSAK